MSSFMLDFTIRNKTGRAWTRRIKCNLELSCSTRANCILKDTNSSQTKRILVC